MKNFRNSGSGKRTAPARLPSNLGKRRSYNKMSQQEAQVAPTEVYKNLKKQEEELKYEERASQSEDD